jgi:hypothetical protein
MKSITSFDKFYAVDEAYKIWEKHLKSLDDHIERRGDEDMDSFEYVKSYFDESDRWVKLILYRSMTGNVLGTIACYTSVCSYEREVVLYVHPNNWRCKLGRTLLLEGIKTWNLDHKRDTIHYFGW